jgi:hypothetical protein
MKRIKHNDLMPVVHSMITGTLPPAYLKSCKEIFGDSLQASKPRAASRKRQAASNKQKGKNVRNFYNFY